MAKKLWEKFDKVVILKRRNEHKETLSSSVC